LVKNYILNRACAYFKIPKIRIRTEFRKRLLGCACTVNRIYVYYVGIILSHRKLLLLLHAAAAEGENASKSRGRRIGRRHTCIQYNIVIIIIIRLDVESSVSVGCAYPAYIRIYGSPRVLPRVSYLSHGSQRSSIRNMSS